jgi:hypothetical protein
LYAMEGWGGGLTGPIRTRENDPSHAQQWSKRAQIVYGTRTPGSPESKSRVLRETNRHWFT